MANSEVLIIVRAINQASSVLKQAEGDVGRLATSTKSLAVEALAAGAILAGFAASVKAAYDFGKEGAQLEQLQATGTQLAKSFGVDMTEAVAKVKAASLGTISTVKAVGEVNRLMLLGITHDTDTMAKLMQIAALRGRAFGLTTEESFDRITLGIGRLSTRILDDIGIVIKGQEAYDAYARSIGKTADQLTGVEQRIALTNAIIEDGNKLLAASGGLSDDNATKIQRMEASLTDLGNTIKMSVAPYVANFAEGMTAIIDLTPKILVAFTAQIGRVIELATDYEYLNRQQRDFINGVTLGIIGSGASKDALKKETDAIKARNSAMEEYLRGERATLSAEQALVTYRAGEKGGPGAVAALQRGAKEIEVRMAFRDKALAIEQELHDSILGLDLDLSRQREDIATDLSRRLADIGTDLARKLQDINTDLANKDADINKDHNDKMLDAEKDYQRRRKSITDRFELARLRALMDLDGRALFEAEQGRDADLADAAQTRAQKKKDEQDEYQRKLRDNAIAAERERQQAQINAQRQQADANQNYQRQMADARLAYARRFNDLSLASQKEFTLWVQGQQAITQFLRAIYAVQEHDYANHLNTMSAYTAYVAGEHSGTAPIQTGSLSLNVNVAGTGSLQQIVQQTTYNTMYDIFTLPGGQQVWKLKGL